MKPCLKSYGTAVLAITAVALFALPQRSQAQTTQTTYSGEAYVVGASVGLVNVDLEDTGKLPPGGGSLSTELLKADVPGLLDVDLLSASTVGANNQTTSNASVANVTLTAAGLYITASVLTSNATASCHPGQASDSGSSTIAGLTVNGLSITVTGEPNQTIPLIVGSLIINEQISSTTVSSSLSAADMVVNALHLKVNLLADVVISSSHAGMKCKGGGIVGIAG
jgi:hypothetical protein